MRFILDISKAKKPAFWEEGDPVLLPCENGKNLTTYDLIESELPHEFVEKMRGRLMKIKGPDGKPYHYGSAKMLPVGIDAEEIVENGGVLREA